MRVHFDDARTPWRTRLDLRGTYPMNRRFAVRRKKLERNRSWNQRSVTALTGWVSYTRRPGTPRHRAQPLPRRFARQDVVTKTHRQVNRDGRVEWWNPRRGWYRRRGLYVLRWLFLLFLLFVACSRYWSWSSHSCCCCNYSCCCCCSCCFFLSSSILLLLAPLPDGVHISYLLLLLLMSVFPTSPCLCPHLSLQRTHICDCSCRIMSRFKVSLHVTVTWLGVAEQKRWQQTNNQTNKQRHVTV